MMYSAAQFVTDQISRWEGKMSRDPNDAGNWSTGRKGEGRLLGSNYGVTGRTLAAYTGMSIDSLTMNSVEAITLPLARDISLKLFYTDVGLSKLPWCRVTASLLDFGWGAGPVPAIKRMQDLLDCNPDGIIGTEGETVKAYRRRLGRGEEFFAGAWWAMREEYYEDLCVRRPSDQIYLRGWDNRSDYFTPGHSEGWWVRFNGG